MNSIEWNKKYWNFTVQSYKFQLLLTIMFVFSIYVSNKDWKFRYKAEANVDNNQCEIALKWKILRYENVLLDQWMDTKRCFMLDNLFSTSKIIHHVTTRYIEQTTFSKVQRCLFCFNHFRFQKYAFMTKPRANWSCNWMQAMWWGSGCTRSPLQCSCSGSMAATLMMSRCNPTLHCNRTVCVSPFQASSALFVRKRGSCLNNIAFSIVWLS